LEYLVKSFRRHAGAVVTHRHSDVFAAPRAGKIGDIHVIEGKITGADNQAAIAFDVANGGSGEIEDKPADHPRIGPAAPQFGQQGEAQVDSRGDTLTQGALEAR